MSEDQLEAAPLQTTLHLLLHGQRYPWRFIKTTALHWKRSSNTRSDWYNHHDLATLITHGTITNFKGEPL